MKCRVCREAPPSCRLEEAYNKIALFPSLYGQGLVMQLLAQALNLDLDLGLGLGLGR